MERPNLREEVMSGWSELSNGAKMISVIAGAVAAIATGIVAIPPAWEVLGLPAAATKMFVLDALARSDAQTKKEIDALKFDLAQSKGEVSAARADIGNMRRAQITSEKFKLEQDFIKAENEGHKQLIRREIERLEIEDDVIQDRLKGLRR